MKIVSPGDDAPLALPPVRPASRAATDTAVVRTTIQRVGRMRRPPVSDGFPQFIPADESDTPMAIG